MPVTMIPVKSSNIAKIGYDALALQLNVEFENGKTFGYKYVSSRDFDKLICANSVGKHFNALIKPNRVAFEIVDKAVEENTEKDGWISVNDRLPLDEAWVLVFADGAINCMWCNPVGEWRDPTESRAMNVDIDSITHWQPLPEPPK